MQDLTDDLLTLDLEYRLTIAHRIHCECAPYLARRREVLIPEMLAVANRRREDPADVCARFARGVHKRHLAGLSLDTPARAA